MADYPRITPPTLANWMATIDNPTSQESSDKLWQIDLQTRRFVYDYLATKFDPTSEFLATSVFGPATFNGLISGSDTQGNQRSIVQGTIGPQDIRDGGVTTTELADKAVTTAKLADNAVTAAQLADNSVDTAAIQAGAVGTSHFAMNAVDSNALKSDPTGAAGAVTTAHVRFGAITTPLLAQGAVTADKLFPATQSGQILVAGDSPFQFAAVTMSGGASIDKTGNVTIKQNNISFVCERSSNGIACGASAAGWQTRGSTTKWAESWYYTGSGTTFVTIDPSGKLYLLPGTYMIESTSPAYKANGHITRLVRYNSLNSVMTTFYGTSCDTSNADATTSLAKALFTMAVGDYVQLEHYMANADTQGLGYPVGAGGMFEVYATMLIRQLA